MMEPHAMATYAQPARRPTTPVRRCACGGVVGPTGECAACRARRLDGDVGSSAGDRSGTTDGRSLDPAIRATMERSFGHDFGRVRVHTDPSAVAAAGSLRARAFTVGSDIAFGEGAYAPDRPSGRSLLAHELAHVVQQRGAGGDAVAAAAPSAEREARAAAAAVVRGRSVSGLSARPLELARQGVDAGVDAGVGGTGGAPSTSPRASSPEGIAQMLCVMRLGGCTNMRPAGIPSPEEMASYNAQCRRETSYAGPDVTPSDEECTDPPEMPSDSLLFARSLSRLYPGWLEALPSCPCTDAEARSSSDWSGPGACQAPYHVGAASGYRSARGYASVAGTNHGQQCCYDEAGLLITEGAGAGTPDLVQAPAGKAAALWGTIPFTSSPGLGAAWSHYNQDVVPFNDLGWEVYNQYWVPNNGRGCPRNRKP
jgi:hypothetical protein